MSRPRSLRLACNNMVFAVQYGAFEDHNSIVLVEEYASMVSQDTALSLCMVARIACVRRGRILQRIRVTHVLHPNA